jgi:hypothetical protein
MPVPGRRLIVYTPEPLGDFNSSEAGEVRHKGITRGQPPDPDGNPYLQLWRDVVRYQFIYSVVSLFLGLCCIIAGTVLFLLGVTGQSSWTVKLLGARSELADAAPGTILFVVGLFYVFITRYVVKPAEPRKWTQSRRKT